MVDVQRPERTGLPSVLIYSLGGTISSRSGESGFADVAIDGVELVSANPQIGRVADVSVTSYLSVASVDLDLWALVKFAKVLDAVPGDHEPVGVVVTQGTDTLEETAFALDVLMGSSRPLVLTGAMRPQDAPGSDGGANLTGAVRIAASESARGLGALVYMNDQIHAARYVRKSHTTRPSAFSSPTVGPIGYVVEDRVRIPLRPRGRFHVDVSPSRPPARVAQVGVGIGSDPGLISVVPELGYRGLVISAPGGGHVPSRLMDTIAKVARTIPVVIASRTGAGEGLIRTYGYPGSEVDWIKAGAISSLGLGPSQAAVLLSLLLSQEVQEPRLQQAFADATDPGGQPNDDP